jgi:hypothetical protein
MTRTTRIVLDRWRESGSQQRLTTDRLASFVAVHGNRRLFEFDEVAIDDGRDRADFHSC